MSKKIVPDMTFAVSSYPEILKWLATLSQTQLRELHALNRAWWKRWSGEGTDEVQEEGKVMGDWIEEHGGERVWWKLVELREER